MKLCEILEAGYKPTAYDGSIVLSYEHIPKLKIIRLTLINKRVEVIGDSINHEDVPIRFHLMIGFNEDIANAALLTRIIPVNLDTDLSDVHKYALTIRKQSVDLSTSLDRSFPVKQLEESFARQYMGRSSDLFKPTLSTSDVSGNMSMYPTAEDIERIMKGIK